MMEILPCSMERVGRRVLSIIVGWLLLTSSVETEAAGSDHTGKDGDFFEEIENSSWSGIATIQSIVVSLAANKTFFALSEPETIYGEIPSGAVWTNLDAPEGMSSERIEKEYDLLLNRSRLFQIDSIGRIHLSLEASGSDAAVLQSVRNVSIEEPIDGENISALVQDVLNIESTVLRRLSLERLSKASDYVIDSGTLTICMSRYDSEGSDIQYLIIRIISGSLANSPPFPGSLLPLLAGASSEAVLQQAIPVVIANGNADDLLWLAGQSSSAHADIRIGALLAASRIATEPALGAMARLLCNDMDLGVRRTTVEMIPVSEVMNSLECIESALFDPSVILNYTALIKIQPFHHSQLILDMLEDRYAIGSSATMQARIIETLLLDPLANVGPLIRIMRDGSNDMSNAIVGNRLSLMGINTAQLQGLVDATNPGETVTLPCGEYLGDLVVDKNDTVLVNEVPSGGASCDQACVIIYGRLEIRGNNVAVQSISQVSDIFWSGNDGQAQCMHVTGSILAKGNNTQLQDFTSGSMTITSNNGRYQQCTVAGSLLVDGNSNYFNCASEGPIINTGHNNNIE